MAEISVACLVKIKSDESTRAHIITRPTFVIGRSAEADLAYVSSTVSRKHIRIELNRDSVTITDLRSNNGTYIDGVPLQAEKPIIVQGNNVIRLGSSRDEFTFQIIPVPLEMMTSEDQKKTLLKNMSEVKEEAEKIGRKALEEERKAFHAQLKLEKEQLKLAFDKELDERRKTIDVQCRELLDGAKRKSEEMLAKGKQSADSYQAVSLQSGMEKKRELENKISALQKEAKELADRIKQQAEAEAKKIIDAAKADAKRDIDAALRNAESLQKEAQRNKQQAELEADKIMKTARADSQKEWETTRKNIEILERDAQVKINDRIRASEREANLLIERARSNADKTKSDADYNAKLKLEDAKHRADKILSEAKGLVDAEVAEQKRIALDSVRAATLEEQEKIIKEYRGTIEKLKATRETLDSEMIQFTIEAQAIKKEHQQNSKELEQLKTDLLEERRLLSEIQLELETAQKIISKSERIETELKNFRDQINAETKAVRAEAEAEVKVAREQMETMKASYEKYKDDYARGMRAIEDELKSKKESTVLEFQAYRKEQEDEAAKTKLDALERLKRTILEEELKYKTTLGLRASEISRAIEERLLPMIEAHLRAKGLSTSLGGVLDNIRHAVDEVLLKDKPAIQAVTEHLGVDPEKEKAKKKVRRQVAAVVAASVVLTLTAFGQPIYEYLKEKRSTYTEYLIAKRSAESIYTPVQNDEWKETYTGNILYLRNYYEAKTDPVYQDQWALRLNNLEFLRSIKLNEDDIIRYIGKEAALITQLWELRQNLDAKYLDEGLGKMNEVEIQTLGEMRDILKSEENYDTVRSTERDFTQQYMKKKFGKAVRLPTSR